MVSTAQILGKRKRVSKKNKKAWRKHTDIADVEKFLEDKLREERTGGKPSEKKDKDLFYIDKTDIFETTKTKLENMKCHSELQIDTRVAPTTGYSGPSKKKKKKKKCAPAAPMDIIIDQPKTESKIYDLWAQGSVVPKKTPDPCLRGAVVKAPEYKSSDTNVTAIELPHPGASYNPTFSDHQDLLKKANEIEVKREKDNLKAKRDAAPPIKITEADYLREMSIGLNGDDASEAEEEVTENEVTCQVTCDRKDRKTRGQRNREKLEKLKAEELAEGKAAKQLSHQLRRIKAIKKEIRAESAAVEEVTKIRQAKKKANEVRPGKYGPGKLPVEQPDFLLPEEISSSLRKLVSPANPIQDRFANMQKRNMVEIRKQVVPHRKYALKYVEKWRRKLPEELKELTKMKSKKKKKVIKMSE